MREPVFTETLQIALVVSDLEESLRTYVEEYGIGPWEIYEFNPGNVSDLHPAGCSWRLAVTMVGSVQWELIQPLDDRSIYAEFLATKGEGVHHVAVGGRPYREELDAMRAKGRTMLQGGVYNGRHLRVPLDERGSRRDHRDLRLAGRPVAGAGLGLPPVGRFRHAARP